MDRITEYRGFDMVRFPEFSTGNNIAVVDGYVEIGPLFPSVEAAKNGIDNYLFNGQFE